MDKDARFFNRDAWKAVLIALIVVIGGEIVLAWQYNTLERRRIPQIEQELLRQQERAERDQAERILRDFLDARLAHDTQRATRYLAENAMEQSTQGAFQMFGDWKSYTIQSAEKLSNETFRFRVEFGDTEERVRQIELIKLIKILDEYYIDSIKLAG